MGLLPGVGLVRSRRKTDESTTVDVDYHLSVVKDLFGLVFEILVVKHSYFYLV
jgi:hypothetical protein